MQKFKERFDALGDAIVAIAMTILVLEISAPTNSKELGSFINHIGLFALSFTMIFNFWYERTLNEVSTDNTNDEIIVLDAINHLLVCLIPLMTKFMMDYEDRSIAVVAYVLLNFVISLLQDIIRLRYINYGFIKNLPDTISKETLENRIRQFTVRTNGWILVFAIFAYFNPNVGVYTYLILPVVTFVRRYRVGRALAKQGRTLPSMMVLYARPDRKNKDELFGRQRRR
ncbi:TMEM175 family protein [Streptococcus hyointestinalis]|uniref:TMEM175 family protein n=1 Tax=Streptococcus hyointestinalis TaxID=1337 RepID=UPI0035139C5A